MEQELTYEEALRRFKLMKERKRQSIERLQAIGIREFEKRTGEKATYFEVL